MKNLVILAVLAAVLVSAAWYLSKEEEKTIEQAAVPVREVFGGAMTSGTLMRIDIAQPEKAVVSLREQDGVWYVDEGCTRKANMSLVNSVISKLEKSIKGEVVSTGKSSVGNYGLSETSATRVKFYKKDGHSDEWLLGKAGTNYMSSYVKTPASDEILSANTNLTNVFNSTQTWRDRSVWSLKAANITSVEAKGTSSTYKLLVDGGTKRIDGRDTTISMVKANDVVNAVSSVSSNDFIDDATTETLAQYGLSPVYQEIVVTYSDSTTSAPKTKSLLLGKFDELRNLCYAKESTSPDILLIDGATAKKMLTSIDELAPLPVAPLPDPKTIATSATLAVDALQTTSAM